MKKRSSPFRALNLLTVAHTQNVSDERRLLVLFDELQELFVSPSNSATPFAFVDADTPHITIHNASGENSGQVAIDPESGLYVFSTLDKAASIAMATANEERLIDEIFAHICVGATDLTPHTVTSAVSVLVGQTVADVERTLIIQTLRCCSGNLAHSAFLLDISLVTLTNKLAAYFARTSSDFSDTVKDAKH